MRKAAISSVTVSLANCMSEVHLKMYDRHFNMMDEQIIQLTPQKYYEFYSFDWISSVDDGKRQLSHGWVKDTERISGAFAKGKFAPSEVQRICDILERECHYRFRDVKKVRDAITSWK